MRRFVATKSIHNSSHELLVAAVQEQPQESIAAFRRTTGGCSERDRVRRATPPRAQKIVRGFLQPARVADRSAAPSNGPVVQAPTLHDERRLKCRIFGVAVLLESKER